MGPLAQIRNAATAITTLLLILVSTSPAQNQTQRPSQPNIKKLRAAAPARHAPFVRAVVVDDRLSSLRREPNMQSQIIHRLRIGRPVFITRFWSAGPDQPRFCRIAVTRRTRGWIHESALAVQSRADEDQRIMKLIEGTTDGLDRIALCRVLIERFSQSKLIPRALLMMGEEAERAAKSLSKRARKRLAVVAGENANASVRDYYLNDVGLDRYSKLHIAFDFNESKTEYVYDGRAYRDVVKRFPDGEEARLARRRLELATNRAARQM